MTTTGGEHTHTFNNIEGGKEIVESSALYKEELHRIGTAIDSLTASVNSQELAIKELQRITGEWSSQPPSGGMVHPGVLNTIENLTKVKPEWWASIPTRYRTGSNYSTTPVEIFVSDPQMTGHGRRLVDDGCSAYVRALDWSVNQNATAREEAILILSAWADLKEFQDDKLQTRRLCAMWSACTITRALELLPDFPKRSALINTLKTVFWPMLDWWGGANWLASFAEAKLGIAVVADDKDLFSEAEKYYRDRIKECIYITKDGPKVIGLRDPSLDLLRQHWVQPKGWDGTVAGKVTNGQSAEEPRDLSHTSMGFGSWVNGALTLKAQGVKLGEDVEERLRSGLERHAANVLAFLGGTSTIPSGGLAYKSGWEPSLWLGLDLPTVKVLVPRVRPSTSGNHLVAETYTHGGFS